MKQKDITLIVVIAVISAVVSFVASNKLFVTPSNRAQQVEVVDSIDSSFNTPSKKYFNNSSIDPTQNSTIGGDTNQNPFNSNGE
jgi:hypothetical protein